MAPSPVVVYGAAMVKLLAPLTLEAPPDAPADELGVILRQLRSIILPEGWNFKLGIIHVEHPSHRVMIDQKSREQSVVNFTMTATAK